MTRVNELCGAAGCRAEQGLLQVAVTKIWHLMATHGTDLAPHGVPGHRPGTQSRDSMAQTWHLAQEPHGIKPGTPRNPVAQT